MNFYMFVSTNFLSFILLLKKSKVKSNCLFVFVFKYSKYTEVYHKTYRLYFKVRQDPQSIVAEYFFPMYM